MFAKFFSLVVLVGFLSLEQANSCGIAPRFWCDSVEIARKCGVLAECSSRLKQGNDKLNGTSPVRVSVYFESYCPDSINFITTVLYPTWEKLHSTGIIHLMLIPYGKAHYVHHRNDTYTFTCQHGEKECIGNKIENCVIREARFITTKYLPVVQCMESAPDPNSAAEECCMKQGFDWEKINNCAEGPEGSKLLHQAGVATERLEPKLNFVPWIVINGMHTDEMQAAALKDLTSVVCETYQGVKPAECHSAHKIKFISHA
ncbi:unnamed protein product [Clavelina lepadiformis]|uniref:Saposin A-type domain-containing protein n=1 Tax=Clavelina lepadiformis TaxID=159417 RepID=A0ABP0EZ23_CLALP